MASVDWDGYRKAYPTNREIDNLYPVQAQGHVIHFASMFRLIGQMGYRVIELGCHNGRLAKRLLDDFECIDTWTGYDFEWPIRRTVCSDLRYNAISLDEWFHDTELPEFNTFICSHTLEHLSEAQLAKTLRHIADADNILIEVPLSEDGMDWSGFGCTHVLRLGLKHIRQWLAQNGFHIFYDVPRLGVLGASKGAS